MPTIAQRPVEADQTIFEPRKRPKLKNEPTKSPTKPPTLEDAHATMIAPMPEMVRKLLESKFGGATVPPVEPEEPEVSFEDDPFASKTILQLEPVPRDPVGASESSTPAHATELELNIKMRKARSEPIVPREFDAPQDPPRAPSTLLGGRPVAQAPEPARLFEEISIAPPTSPETGGAVPLQPEEFLSGPQVQGLIESAPPAQASLQFEISEEVDPDVPLEGEFGQYNIVRLIARGAESTVYLAEHQSSGKEVALKVLDRTGQEAQNFISSRGDALVAAARLESKNVVRVLDVGRVAQRHYVALEYVSGWTLAERLDADDRPDLKSAIKIARDVARALLQLERREVVHGDLRADNIIISQHGVARLTGFGFAGDQRIELNGKTLEFRGALSSVAPEVLLGHQPDHRADLYAFGGTLYALFTGRTPFEPGEQLQLSEAPEPQLVEPQLPEPIAALVRQLLQPAPDLRTITVESVLETLSNLLVEMEAQPAPIEAPSPGRTALSPHLLKISARAVLALALLFGAAMATPPFLSVFGGRLLRAMSSVQGAMISAVAHTFAALLLMTIALIRKGQIPVPMSSTWLVRAQEGAGVLGATCMVVHLAAGPWASLSILGVVLAGVVLGSWLFGLFLRRGVALLRADGGIGRMLAVLSDPALVRWRTIHVPMVSMITALALARFALVAYFAST